MIMMDSSSGLVQALWAAPRLITRMSANTRVKTIFASSKDISTTDGRAAMAS